MTPDSPCLAKARSFLSALFPWSSPLRRSVCVCFCVCVSMNLGESHMMHMMHEARKQHGDDIFTASSYEAKPEIKQTTSILHMRTFPLIHYWFGDLLTQQVEDSLLSFWSSNSKNARTPWNPIKHSWTLQSTTSLHLPTTNQVLRPRFVSPRRYSSSLLFDGNVELTFA